MITSLAIENKGILIMHYPHEFVWFYWIADAMTTTAQTEFDKDLRHRSSKIIFPFTVMYEFAQRKPETRFYQLEFET